MSTPASKLSGKLVTQLNRNLRSTFEEYLPELKDVYLNTYHSKLDDVVTDSNSLANPDYFYEDYATALDNFDYFYDESEDADDSFRIKIPTEDTFPFSGRLNFIHILINGIIGDYYELSQEDYNTLINSNISDDVKSSLYELSEFFDDATSEDLRFYLISSLDSLYKTVQSMLNKDLTLFPFSNSPPIDLFEDGVDAFNDHFDSLVNAAINTSIKEEVHK